MRAVERLKKEGRILDIVSRGGSFLLEWMIYNEKDNPLYEQYDRLLEIALKYDMTLSLGDGMRPGCIADATDRTQLEELLTLGELRDMAVERNVQVIIEGPGHVPLNQVELTQWLDQGLSKIDERCRNLLLALYFDPQEVSYINVAEKMGIPVSSIGPTRARCLEKLKQVLQKA